MTNYNQFLENIVNDKDEPTKWNHKNLLTFKDYSGDQITSRKEKRIIRLKSKKPKASKEISKKVL